MCDTFAAVNTVTKDGSVILGKNSDRQPNEPHHILHVPAASKLDEEVKCTYISIPQVDETYEVILSKPQWIWGAEMGVNEHGVSIGNEAVWTTEMSKEPSLIGMDFLRLGLERAKSARQALEVITDLLQLYGQGGNCGFDQKDFYDNSFIIADENDAWVLETAGKFWIAEKVKTIRTISNCLTIEDNYDLIHPDLIDYAISKGKCTSEDDFNFRNQFSTKFMPWAAKGDKRRTCTLNILESETGKVTPKTAFQALRSHNKNEDEIFSPRKSSMASPCVHASSILTPSQSTASMVSHIRKDQPIHWFTGTSSPCLSVFKPLVTGNGLYRFDEPKRTFDNQTLWWKHEVLHRLTLLNYNQLYSLYKEDKEEFENNIYNEIYNEDLSIKLPKEKQHESLQSYFAKNEVKVESWIDKISNEEINKPFSGIRYRMYWNKHNKKAKIVLN